MRKKGLEPRFPAGDGRDGRSGRDGSRSFV